MKIRATLFLTINRKTSDKKNPTVWFIGSPYDTPVVLLYLLKRVGMREIAWIIWLKPRQDLSKPWSHQTIKRCLVYQELCGKYYYFFIITEGTKKSRCLNLYLKRHNSIWKTNKINLLKASFAASRLYFIIIISVIALKTLNTLGFFLFWTLIKYN